MAPRVGTPTAGVVGLVDPLLEALGLQVPSPLMGPPGSLSPHLLQVLMSRIGQAGKQVRGKYSIYL